MKFINDFKQQGLALKSEELQSVNGSKQWKNKLHYKKALLLLLFVASTAFSCTNKKEEVKILAQQSPDNSIIGKTLSSLYESKYFVAGNDLVVAPELKKHLNSSSDKFVQVGAQLLEKTNVRVTALKVADSKQNAQKTNPQDCYLFFEKGKNFEIIDFIKVDKGKDYVSNVIFENNTSGIAVGVFSESQEYFELQELFEVNSSGKKNKLSLSTVILDCPVPTDYVGEEDSGNYKFGVKSGKKYSRFWKENTNQTDAKQSGDFVLKQATVSSNGKDFKISVYEKNEKKLENAQHFDLKIEISEKAGNVFRAIKSNQNIIASVDGNCAADGFTDVVSKDNYFTIEQTFCKNVLYVNAYTTFKIVGNNVLLHKYTETYTDRNNPDKVLQDKKWTAKEFGQVKFENFNHQTSIKR